MSYWSSQRVHLGNRSECKWYRTCSSATLPEGYSGPSLVLDSNFDPETTPKAAYKIQAGLCDWPGSLTQGFQSSHLSWSQWGLSRVLGKICLLPSSGETFFLVGLDFRPRLGQNWTGFGAIFTTTFVSVYFHKCFNVTNITNYHVPAFVSVLMS